MINLFNHPWIFNQKISIMRIFLILFLLAASYSSGVSQEIFNSKPKLIGSCEGCEAIFEYGEKKLSQPIPWLILNDRALNLNLRAPYIKMMAKRLPGMLYYIFITPTKTAYMKQRVMKLVGASATGVSGDGLRQIPTAGITFIP